MIFTTWSAAFSVWFLSKKSFPSVAIMIGTKFYVDYLHNIIPLQTIKRIGITWHLCDWNWTFRKRICNITNGITFDPIKPPDWIQVGIQLGQFSLYNGFIMYILGIFNVYTKDNPRSIYYIQVIFMVCNRYIRAWLVHALHIHGLYMVYARYMPSSTICPEYTK